MNLQKAVADSEGTDPLMLLIRRIESDSLLDEPSHFAQRIEMLDRLDAYDLERAISSRPRLPCRALEIQARLEEINSRIYAALRRDVRMDAGARSLAKWLALLNWRESITRADSDGYDFLDELVIGVIQFPEPEQLTASLSDEMVHYQPTPARHIFDLLERTSLTGHDELVDIGSGLGHVPILAAICSAAKCIGIELERAYVQCAREAAASLSLERVSFIQADARSVDFSTGTVFYLYTPFTGSILRDTLDRLRAQAERRSIRVCTFGPCTAAIAAESWLIPIGRRQSRCINIFQSVPV